MAPTCVPPCKPCRCAPHVHNSTCLLGGTPHLPELGAPSTNRPTSPPSLALQAATEPLALPERPRPAPCHGSPHNSVQPPLTLVSCHPSQEPSVAELLCPCPHPGWPPCPWSPVHTCSPPAPSPVGTGLADGLTDCAPPAPCSLWEPQRPAQRGDVCRAPPSSPTVARPPLGQLRAEGWDSLFLHVAPPSPGS